MANHWNKRHVGCPCSRYTDFSIARGKELVAQIEHAIKEALPENSYLPNVVWVDEADPEGSLACRASPENDVIQIAKGSCVSWATTLVACVHAISHVLCEDIQGCVDENDDPNPEETDPRHCFKWRGTVNWIQEVLVTSKDFLEEGHSQCIKACILKLRKVPSIAESTMSAPAFLLQARSVTGHFDFGLTYTTDDAIKQRRQEVYRGTTRWRFQDEFDIVEAAMKQDGRVGRGSVVELALELKRDHDPLCRCCCHYQYDLKQAQALVENLADVLRLYLAVSYEDTPVFKCTLSLQKYKSRVSKKDEVFINLNRLETYADALRVIIREWARRYVVSQFNVGPDVRTHNHYLLAVAGFSSLLIGAVDCHRFLNNWFPEKSCLCLALTPAPLWVDGFVPLYRLRREGALKILADGTFDDLTPLDLDASRERVLALRERAMHPDIEGTTSFEDATDYLATRFCAAVMEGLLVSVPTVITFYLECPVFEFATNFLVAAKTSVAELTAAAISEVERQCEVPYVLGDHYEVFFNGELLDDSEKATEVAKVGRTIRVEPVKYRVRPLKGWTSDAYEEVEVFHTITAAKLLEKLKVTTPEHARIVVGRRRLSYGDGMLDLTKELRVFLNGVVTISAEISIGSHRVCDYIFIDRDDMSGKLKPHLERWQRIYGFGGDIDCEGSRLTSEVTVKDKVDDVLREYSVDTPLRVFNLEPMNEDSVPTYAISVNDSTRNHLGELRVKAHNTLAKGFCKLCKSLKIPSQSAGLTTADGRVVEIQSTIFEVFLDDEPLELILIRKETKKRPARKRLHSSNASDHGPASRRRVGKFAHPRPSVGYVIISSDSESEPEE